MAQAGADVGMARPGGAGFDRRVERAFAQARRHSGRVRLLKLALPLSAVLMVAAFAGTTWLSAPSSLPIDIRSLAIEDGRLVMNEPRLDGLTGKEGRAYSMTATRAVQDIGASGRIDLEGIDARLPVDEKGWMTFTAASGALDRDASRLDIDSELTMTSDGGMRAVLQSATLDMATGSLDTADPVDITLDGTHIQADSMSVRDKGAVVVFENRVRMTIDGGRLGGASASGGETQ